MRLTMPHFLLLCGLLVTVAGLVPALRPASAQTQGHPAFERVWQRTDGPVVAGQVNRPFVWGAAPLYTGRESYAGGTRQVQYYHKARMEVADTGAPPDMPLFVTNGRLVHELVSGHLDLGNGLWQDGSPAHIPVVGTPADNPHVPTYASFRFVASLEEGSRMVPRRIGQPVTETMARDGFIGQNPHLGGLVTIAAYSEETGHNIPNVFVDYMARRGPVWDGFDLVTETIIDGPLTIGFPLTEAYWTQAIVDGQGQDVLIQLYERRTLLYWPARSPEHQVEMGDVGLHYFTWRYHSGVPIGQVMRHKDLELVVTLVERATVETGPLPAPPPPTPATPATPTPRPRRGQPTPTPAPTATPTPLPGIHTSGVFVIAHVSVTNVGLATTSLRLEEFLLVDSLGRRYDISPDVTALAARRLQREDPRGGVRAGFSAHLVRVWEVPADARGLIMVPAYGEKPAILMD